VCWCIILPITINARPDASNGKALNDLCFLYPKHKLVIPNNKEAERKAHSNVSDTNRDKLRTGNTTIIKGMIVQWKAQIMEATAPILSSLFMTAF
jgi:hypothetical protein